MTVFLNSIGTAVPPHELPQDVVLDNARRILGPRYSQFERMASTFTTSGVEKRYSMAPIDWFQKPKSWVERNQTYLNGSKSLFIEAAQNTLTNAGLKADQIDTIVTVSSTGVATPTIEALAWKEMGFRTDARRIPIFGLGCAGGVSGLSIAQAQAEARPGSHVLIVALEACTLSFRSDRLQKADIIATILFGDGAAGACLSTVPTDSSSSVVKIGKGEEEMWADTLDIMGWNVEESGLGVVFDRSIPAFVEENLAAASDRALGRMKLCRNEIDRFVCHPGGAKVVKAIETSLGLESESLKAERETLKDFGNMSAPTALFVLKRVLAEGIKGQIVVCALGPGFTASFIPLKVST